MTREEAIEHLRNLSQANFYPSTIMALDMAIEALQNLSKPNNACEVDLISRQEALDMLCEDCRFISAEDCEYKDVCKTRRFILSLPSAETPTNTPTNTPTDLISRQDAIDAVENANPNDWMYHYYKHIAVEELSKFPSAQGGDADMNEVKSPFMQQSPNDGADLISRQDAIDVVGRFRNIDGISVWHNGIKESIRIAIIEDLAKLPSADRPTGEWVKDELGSVICSECKGYRRDNRVSHTNFCNRCGAKMGGDTT